jgi:hypothetical protein
MNSKCRLRMQALLLTIALFGSRAAFGLTPGSDAGFRLGPIQLISVHQSGGTTGRPFDLVASGQNVIWQVEYASQSSSIEGFDFATNQRFTVRPESGLNPIQPDISGNTVVWSERFGAGNAIYMHDLISRQTLPLQFGGDLVRTYPGISGDKLVWQQFISDSRDSDVYTASAPAWTPMLLAPTAFNPDIDGTRVVMNDPPKGATVVDLSNPGVRFESDRPTVIPDRPRVVANFVAWHSFDGIELANLTTHQQTTFSQQEFFSLGNDMMVYYDYLANPDELVAVRLTDGATSVLKQVGSNSTGPGYLALSGRRLTWVEVEFGQFNNHTYRIYSALIVPEPSGFVVALLSLLGVATNARRFVS